MDNNLYGYTPKPTKKKHRHNHRTTKQLKSKLQTWTYRLENPDYDRKDCERHIKELKHSLAKRDIVDIKVDQITMGPLMEALKIGLQSGHIAYKDQKAVYELIDKTRDHLSDDMINELKSRKLI